MPAWIVWTACRYWALIALICAASFASRCLSSCSRLSSACCSASNCFCWIPRCFFSATSAAAAAAAAACRRRCAAPVLQLTVPVVAMRDVGRRDARAAAEPPRRPDLLSGRHLPNRQKVRARPCQRRVRRRGPDRVGLAVDRDRLVGSDIRAQRRCRVEARAEAVLEPVLADEVLEQDDFDRDDAQPGERAQLAEQTGRGRLRTAQAAGALPPRERRGRPATPSIRA